MGCYHQLQRPSSSEVIRTGGTRLGDSRLKSEPRSAPLPVAQRIQRSLTKALWLIIPLVGGMVGSGPSSSPVRNALIAKEPHQGVVAR
jgi:hypothetical protein